MSFSGCQASYQVSFVLAGYNPNIVKFVYDVAILIELVEERPCLSEKFSDMYKDKIKKSNAWKEVCAFLEKDFEK